MTEKHEYCNDCNNNGTPICSSCPGPQETDDRSWGTISDYAKTL